MDLYDLLRTHEGAGDPNTLFGHSQREGGRFSGVKVSEMNLGQLKDFTNPQGDYGQWVKDELGRMGHRSRVATPMGIPQIVGTTLRSAQKELGLADDVLFDEKTQRMLTNHLANKRINLDDKAATVRGLRQEWEGFKHVDDETLWQVAQNFKLGDTDKSQLNTGKGRLFRFQQDMENGSEKTRSVIDKMAGGADLDMGTTGGPSQLELAKKAMGYQLGSPNEVEPVRMSGQETRLTPPTTYDTGTPEAAPTPESVEEGKNTLMDQIGAFIHPNANNPAEKFRETLGALGVGLGQMSHGQPVNLQPYFNSIAARKQAASDAIQKAEQQRFDNQMRAGTLANQQRQTDVASARLAHDIAKSGGPASPSDYNAIATAHPELADSGLIELAKNGDKDAQKEITQFLGDRLAATDNATPAQQAALNTYLGADTPEQKAAALADLSVDDAKKVVDLADEIGAEQGANDSSAWSDAVNLANDMPELYSSPGEAFKAIKKMEVTGGDTHPELVKMNLKTGTELQLGYNERADEGERIRTTAQKAETAVRGQIKAGSSDTTGIKKTVGKILGNTPFIGAAAKANFYDAVGFDTLADAELTQSQGDMLALIAKDYEGQGEISDSERVEMAKRVISGDMDEKTMMAEIQRMKADGAFKSGDAKVFRATSNSANMHSKHAEAQEKIRDFSNDKRAVLSRQRKVGEFNFYRADGAAGGDAQEDFQAAYYKDGQFNMEKYVNAIAPPVSEEFVKFYAESLPVIEDNNGKAYRVYMTYDGEIKTIPVGR